MHEKLQAVMAIVIAVGSLSILGLRAALYLLTRDITDAGDDETRLPTPTRRTT